MLVEGVFSSSVKHNLLAARHGLSSPMFAEGCLDHGWLQIIGEEPINVTQSLMKSCCYNYYHLPAQRFECKSINFVC
jgi:hypothetical protein